jgi:hypothetical protein
MYELYHERVGGKTRGEYYLSRDQMLALAYREIFRKVFIEAVMQELRKRFHLILTKYSDGGFNVRSDTLRTGNPVFRIDLKKYLPRKHTLAPRSAMRS